MKILHVFWQFSQVHGGGTVILIYQISKALLNKGHEVTIYASDYELDPEYINSLPGLKLISFTGWLNPLGLSLGPVGPSMITRIRHKLKDFDIVHMHFFRSPQNVVLHHYCSQYGIPYVIDTHGSMPKVGRKRLQGVFDAVFGNRILRDASKAIAETQMGVDEYIKAGISSDKIVLLPPPFDTEEFSHLPLPGYFRRKFNIAEKHIIMFLGRLFWKKGIDFLVESFYELTQIRSDTLLVLVGPDGGHKSALEELISRLDLSDKVLFTGFMGGEDKLSALVDADIVVQTSIYEQGAWAPFEAVLCDTPIIVSSNSGTGEDVKKIDAGYLVEYGNKHDLRDKMQYVLNNPDEAAEKTQKAKAYIITNRSFQGEVGKYEKLYRECIEENEKRKRGN